MSKAPRAATWNSRSRSWAGQDRGLGQRMSTSPSFAGASAVPHSGHCVGITNARSLPSRRSTTGPRTSGMTSPALRSTTVSPISTPLRCDLLRRCAGSPCSTVEPATSTGSMTANGVTRPVRPTLTWMSSSLVRDLLGRVLVGDRPPRRPRGRAEPALQRDLVDLDHDAVDLVLDVVAVLAVVGDVVPHLRRGRRRPGTRSEVGRPHAAQRVVGLGLPARLVRSPCRRAAPSAVARSVAQRAPRAAR